MLDTSSLKIIPLLQSNIHHYQHYIPAFFQHLEEEYGGDCRELLEDDSRCFLTAIHKDYGMIGGLCLNPPHSHPPFDGWKSRIVEFFQDLNNCWIGSHLFFHLPEKIEDQLSDNQLMHLHSSVFKAFYHKLIHLSMTWKLPELRLLIDQEQYVNVNCGVLPYLSERHFGLDGQAYVLGHLSLPSFSYALFGSLVNKIDTFDDQLLKQLVEEHQLLDYPFQSVGEVDHVNTILH